MFTVFVKRFHIDFISGRKEPASSRHVLDAFNFGGLSSNVTFDDGLLYVLKTLWKFNSYYKKKKGKLLYLYCIMMSRRVNKQVIIEFHFFARALLKLLLYIEVFFFFWGGGVRLPLCPPLLMSSTLVYGHIEYRDQYIWF